VTINYYTRHYDHFLTRVCRINTRNVGERFLIDDLVQKYLVSDIGDVLGDFLADGLSISRASDVSRTGYNVVFIEGSYAFHISRKCPDLNLLSDVILTVNEEDVILSFSVMHPIMKMCYHVCSNEFITKMAICTKVVFSLRGEKIESEVYDLTDSTIPKLLKNLCFNVVSIFMTETLHSQYDQVNLECLFYIIKSILTLCTGTRETILVDSN
jgi:hypothetical protein